MKLTSAAPLFLILTLAGPALAETSANASTVGACPLIGPKDGTSEECRALRLAYRTEVAACMELLHVEADARSGRATKLNAHTSRARHLICDAEIRSKLGLVSY